jgi:hypothetical protein
VAPISVVWDERNLRHLRERRRCRVPEVEQVIRAICHTARRQRLVVQPGEPTKWKYFGETCDGRFLVVIAEEARHQRAPDHLLAPRGPRARALSCVERDSKGVTMTRKPWPANKPLPRFATEQEELAFWERHDVPWDDAANWEEVPGPVVAIAATRPKAIHVVLPPGQEARLGRIARERRVSKEKVLEAIIGKALVAPARAARRKRAVGA